MTRFDVVKKYLKFVPDFDIYKYCPSYFGLDDRNKYNYKECGQESPPCKECWSDESEVDNEKLLSFIRRLYDNNKEEIKKLHKKNNELLDAIQELCPHKNVYAYDENKYVPWFDKDEEEKIIKKCEDCGKILN